VVESSSPLSLPISAYYRAVTPHLHLLGILQMVWGAMGLLLGASTLMLALGAIAIGWSTPGDELAAGVTAVAFAVFAVALLAGGGANAWVGAAIGRREPSGRLGALWLAVLNLFVLPFGTALAIYAFWVLLHNESRTQFVGGRR
jgi:ABC-type branched-subunit amino acid transport system permease subunit